MEDIKQNFKIINFNAAYVPPKYNWNKAKSWITWGDKNNYPNYLQSLFNGQGSPLHTSIIHKKVSYTVGKGLEDTTDVALNEFIERNDLNDELMKISYDYEILNGFAFEVIWSLDKTMISSIKHIPISQLRFGLLNEDNHLPYFWYCKDWTNTRKFEPEAIRAYNTDFPGGKQIYYYAQYNPQNTLVDYPRPLYENSIDQIENAHEIAQFHLNQAKQGFAPSFILNFATGIPTSEEQEKIYNAFNAGYAGTQNAGKAIVTFSENELQKPTFFKVDLNDSDERFLMLEEYIEKSIVVGHDIPPQLLILTSGKLSGTSEGLDNVEQFKQGYILTRQIKIENILNKILRVNNYSQELILKKDDVKNTVEDTNGN